MHFNAVEIIEKIKDIISIEVGERKVWDRDVATALSIDHTKLSKLKKVDSLPLEEICLFAASRRISINSLLFGQEIEEVRENTRRCVGVKY